MKNLLGNKDVEIWGLRNEMDSKIEQIKNMRKEVEVQRNALSRKGENIDVDNMNKSTTLSRDESTSPNRVRFENSNNNSPNKDNIEKLTHTFKKDKMSAGEYKLSLRNVNNVTKELESLDESSRLDHVMNLIDKPILG